MGRESGLLAVGVIVMFVSSESEKGFGRSSSGQHLSHHLLTCLSDCERSAACSIKGTGGSGARNTSPDFSSPLF